MPDFRYRCYFLFKIPSPIARRGVAAGQDARIKKSKCKQSIGKFSSTWNINTCLDNSMDSMDSDSDYEVFIQLLLQSTKFSQAAFLCNGTIKT